MREFASGKWLPTVVALILVVGILILPYLGIQSPNVTSPKNFEGPSLSHPLGTDHFGRDNLSRTLWALREGVFVTLMTTVIAGGLGLFLGASALMHPLFDRIAGLIVNVSLSVPGLLLALVLLTFFEASIFNVALAVGVSLSPVYARVARSSLITVATNDFVEATIALGAGKIRILLFHLLPNVWRELMGFLAVIFSWAALNVAALDFLGLAGSPSTPTLGNLLVDGRTYLRITPWIALGPGLALTLLTLVAFSLSESHQNRR